MAHWLSALDFSAFSYNLSNRVGNSSIQIIGLCVFAYIMYLVAVGVCVTVHVFKNDAALQKPFPLLRRNCATNTAPVCINAAMEVLNAAPKDANAAPKTITKSGNCT